MIRYRTLHRLLYGGAVLVLVGVGFDAVVLSGVGFLAFAFALLVLIDFDRQDRA